MTSVYLQVAAKLQRETMAMGEPEYLSAKEIELCSATFAGPLSVARAWEFLVVQAGMASY